MTRFWLWVLEYLGYELEPIAPGIYLTNQPVIAVTVGRLIVIERTFASGLTRAELDAVIAHERAHIELRHIFPHLACELFRPSRLRYLNHRQEFEADAEVSRQGLGIEMAKVLEKYPLVEATDSHPSSASRVEKLRNPHGC